MEKYIGTKLIEAEECDFFVYYIQKYGCEKFDKLSSNKELFNKDGYKVLYPDNYIIWSPKETFEDAYKTYDNLTFEMAIFLLKKQNNVGRKKWNRDYIFIKDNKIYKMLTDIQLTIEYIILNEDIQKNDWMVK